MVTGEVFINNSQQEMRFSQVFMLKPVQGNASSFWLETDSYRINVPQMKASAPNPIAQSFLQFYYPTFDSNRKGLGGLYANKSALAFEGKAVQGPTAIVGKLGAFTFKTKHALKSYDSVQCDNGLLVFCNGEVTIDSGKPVKFAHAVMLRPKPNQSGAFWVESDIYRLNYC
jgi:hypothetical protein